VRIPARNGWAIDLMRRRSDAPTGIMEFLVVKSVEHARERGDALLSLSLSALVSVDEPAAPELIAGDVADPGAPTGGPVLEPVMVHEVRDYPRVREFLMQHLARFYDFQNLFRWKRKFDPVYEDRYLVYSDAMSLPRVALALVRAQSPGGLWSYLRRP
jgi:phosphatidylglycerol lysyltransferase